MNGRRRIALEAALSSFFGHAMLTDAITSILVAAFDVMRRSGPWHRQVIDVGQAARVVTGEVFCLGVAIGRSPEWRA